MFFSFHVHSNLDFRETLSIRHTVQSPLHYLSNMMGVSITNILQFVLAFNNDKFIIFITLPFFAP